MGRIFRLVWNHRLDALVVTSEIATARGSLAAGPTVLHLKVPLWLLSLGLASAPGVPLHAVDTAMQLDKGTRIHAAAPVDRANAVVAGLATPTRPALPSGPTGGLAGFGPDVAELLSPHASDSAAIPRGICTV
ncbi:MULTISPECIES: ESPR domain-containing protein [Stenotrophomonas]|uniref:ESPR domain-containing protein n=1 Tax=Stenotrophomonas TaxID=40323 RepID=UPI0008723972|nr:MULTISPECIES: ESPR domain-containing protein [Stenotrophomonas]OEZ02173.1 hypothetical protein BIY45_02240 [Stenotrophomonas sp. BIIR7]